MNTNEVIDTLKRQFEDFEREYAGTFKLSEIDKIKQQKEIVTKIFERFPILNQESTVEQFYLKYGKHSSKVTREAMGSVIKNIISEQLNSYQGNSDFSSLSDLITEIEIPVPTGKTKKVKVSTHDEDSGTYIDSEDYIEVPETEMKKGFFISDKAQFLSTIENTINTALTNQAEAVQTRIHENLPTSTNSLSMRWEMAQLLNEVLNNKKLEIASPEGDNIVVLNLPKAINNHNVYQHYYEMASNLLEGINKANGIVKTIKPFVVSKRVKLEDGTTATQEVTEQKEVIDAGQDSSNFAHTLFNLDVRDDNNNKIVLYKLWTDKLGTILGTQLADWTNKKGQTLSRENDEAFYNLFINCIDKVNDDMRAYYTSPYADGWEPRVPPNPFNKPESNASRTFNYIQETSQQVNNGFTPTQSRPPMSSQLPDSETPQLIDSQLTNTTDNNNIQEKYDFLNQLLQ